mmetsp:Transcript_36756/g.118201  ORF Transcript_36756/g.118201 Transcript_36756/m.118201 type:complete len:282 (-) Transcript_36756:890-1735(-)
MPNLVARQVNVETAVLVPTAAAGRLRESRGVDEDADQVSSPHRHDACGELDGHVVEVVVHHHVHQRQRAHHAQRHEHADAQQPPALLVEPVELYAHEERAATDADGPQVEAAKEGCGVEAVVVDWGGGAQDQQDDPGVVEGAESVGPAGIGRAEEMENGGGGEACHRRGDEGVQWPALDVHQLGWSEAKLRLGETGVQRGGRHRVHRRGKAVNQLLQAARAQLHLAQIEGEQALQLEPQRVQVALRLTGRRKPPTPVACAGTTVRLSVAAALGTRTVGGHA